MTWQVLIGTAIVGGVAVGIVQRWVLVLRGN